MKLEFANMKEGYKMKEILDVFTGKVEISKSDIIIRALALGSCIAIVAYDAKNRIGGIAHIMLPEKAPENKKQEENKYTENAISNLLLQMQKSGADKEEMKFCLAGGANVLRRNDDSIAEKNCISVVQIVKEQKLKIKAKSLGGTQRRCISLDISSGKVNLSVGDNNENIFYVFT